MEIGDTFISKIVVTTSVSAENVGSGDLPVFSTPSMVALMENAAMMAVKKGIPAEKTTVGSSISVKHLKPTAMGSVIYAQATLIFIQNAKLTFSLKAWDDSGTIGVGEHIRYIVDTKKFLEQIV